MNDKSVIELAVYRKEARLVTGGLSETKASAGAHSSPCDEQEMLLLCFPFLVDGRPGRTVDCRVFFPRRDI
jgi:hypothetical protein